MAYFLNGISGEIFRDSCAASQRQAMKPLKLSGRMIEIPIINGEADVRLSAADDCPSCGGELFKARHRYGEGASGNLPDCSWLACLDCGFKTQPE